MKIDEKLVGKIASLANLKFSDEDRGRFASQFADILGFVRQLEEVDTSAVDDAGIHERDDKAVFPDSVLPCLGKEEAMTNAPQKDEDYFLVPKVIEEE